MRISSHAVATPNSARDRKGYEIEIAADLRHKYKKRFRALWTKQTVPRNGHHGSPDFHSFNELPVGFLFPAGANKIKQKSAYGLSAGGSARRCRSRRKSPTFSRMITDSTSSWISFCFINAGMAPPVLDSHRQRRNPTLSAKSRKIFSGI